MKNVHALKLKSSGLTLADAKLLKIDCLSAVETSRLGKEFFPHPCLKFNYFDFDRKPYSEAPMGKPFFRVRYLPVAGFDTAAEKLPNKYVQPGKSMPSLYMPLTVDWKTIAADTSRRLLITEGELKSAKACKEGFPMLGLGGVWAWEAKKQGIEFLPTLAKFDWRERLTYICFDSDFRTNPSVCMALAFFTEELERHGALVHAVIFPEGIDQSKIGVDDFFMLHKEQAKDKFEDLIQSAELVGKSRALWTFNKKYVCVISPPAIVNLSNGVKHAPDTFANYIEAPSTILTRVIESGEAEPSYRREPAVPAWLHWPMRNEAEGITYAPGQGLFTENPRKYNTWPGWGCKPEKGDVTMFTDLIDHLFTDADLKAKEWFYRWCAYPLQYPGSKMYSSAVFHGVRHGTGKSLIGYTLGKIYGENFTEIDQAALHSNFNGWAEGRQLVMGDDVTGSDKRGDADRLKKLITQNKIRINQKFIAEFEIPDCVNYYFTANQPDSFFLEDDDRRFFIHEVTVAPLSEEFYAEYDLWKDSKLGPPAVFDFLLHYPLGDFNPNSPAYKTKARERMIVGVQSDIASWVRDLLMNPAHVLRLGDMPLNKDLFSAKELLGLYDINNKGQVTAGGIGRELAKAGCRQVLEGTPIKTSDGDLSRYFAVRNCEFWLKASLTDCLKHLNDFNSNKKPKEEKKK